MLLSLSLLLSPLLLLLLLCCLVVAVAAVSVLFVRCCFVKHAVHQGVLGTSCIAVYLLFHAHMRLTPDEQTTVACKARGLVFVCVAEIKPVLLVLP